MSAYSGIYTDLNGLAQLRTRAQRRPEAALEEVAGQFEALFTRMMLKTMRESNLGDSLFDSNGTEQYLEMFDNQVALSMSRGRGLGLKEQLIRQLGGAADSEISTNRPAGALPRRPAPLTAAPAAAEWNPANAEEFVRDLAPHARRVARELGVDERAIIAHAALESGWGRHTMRRDDGSNAFALFGIKADAAWRGDRVTVGTLEVRDGVARRERASFRAYDSLADAVNGYADFLRENPRYGTALAQGADARAYARELQAAGYATDPHYAAKLTRIVDSDAVARHEPSTSTN